MISNPNIYTIKILIYQKLYVSLYQLRKRSYEKDY